MAAAAPTCPAHFTNHFGHPNSKDWDQEFRQTDLGVNFLEKLKAKESLLLCSGVELLRGYCTDIPADWGS